MTEEEKTIERLLSSDAKAELLTLFHRNPGLIDTIDGVARRIGRRPAAIEKDIADLVELGILKKKRISSSEAIFFDRTRDKEVQEIISNYIKGLKEKSGG